MENLIDWEKTSLKPYVEMLDRHAAALMDETRQAARNGMGMLFSASFVGLLTCRVFI